MSCPPVYLNNLGFARKFKRNGSGNPAQPPNTVEQLREQCAKQREFMTRDLVGPSRKFVSDLYIPRPSANAIFQEFKQSTDACLAILGESGVGKSNLLVALSEPDDEGIQTLFYEGIRLKSGLTPALKEDMPWAFGVNNSVDEAGKVISAQFQKLGLKLYIFIDALDDVVVAMRTELVDVVRKLSLQGIRFVVSCKDVVWPEFVRRDGASNAFADTIFPKPRKEEKEKLPGWTLDRCDQQDLDVAWEKYSKFYNLTGQRSLSPSGLFDSDPACFG